VENLDILSLGDEREEALREDPTTAAGFLFQEKSGTFKDSYRLSISLAPSLRKDVETSSVPLHAREASDKLILLGEPVRGA
jgi:hypothetical protein